VRLYEHALTLAPNSVRVLNNLAIALSELDDRSGDALAVINRAIDLVGESPELLDTLGMVLFRTGNFSDAISRLREAAATSNDTRHRFHLLMALLETGDEAEALAIWSRLDFQELKRATLTPSERIALKRIDQQFNNNPAKRNNK
jgi:Flp pilus assembly protein TadD